MEEKKRQTDSDVVAALIWLAFVVPGDIPPVEDDGRTILGFRRALDFYAKTVEREEAAEALRKKTDGPVMLFPMPEPKSDTVPSPEAPASQPASQPRPPKVKEKTIRSPSSSPGNRQG